MSDLSNRTRKAVYKRDGFECAICGSRTSLQIHHVVPRGKGGSNLPWNLITLCHACHAQAHGIIMTLPGFTQEDMEQAIVEYVADYYAGLGFWWINGRVALMEQGERERD